MSRPKKPRVYYSLLTREDGQWAPQFGDYDLDTVKFERDDYRDRGHKAKDLKIITTTDEQADINRAVFELNEAGK
ncbi:hypothetical protein MAUB1S_10129 [Mycolicibacterium aubagnense]